MIVVALDPPFESRSGSSALEDIVKQTDAFVSGYKVGLPLLIQEGPGSIRRIRNLTEKRIIADLKLADIGEIMAKVLRILVYIGIDAVIAHTFIGIEDALDILVNEANRQNIDIILVASMSHKGSSRYIDSKFGEFIRDALELKVHGVVIGAGKKDLIRTTREIAGNQLKIYTPGIGAQGAKPGDGLCAGADYEIIGRLITNDPEPGIKAKEIYYTQLTRLRECHGSR